MEKERRKNVISSSFPLGERFAFSEKLKIFH